MASPRFVALVGLMAIAACMALGAPKGADAAVTCGTVVRSLLPCVSYVQNGGPTVPDACCGGIKMLNGMAKGTSDRRSVCGCLKSAVGGVSFSSRTANLAAGLPKKCGVNIPYKISPSTDCNSVK